MFVYILIGVYIVPLSLSITLTCPYLLCDQTQFHLKWEKYIVCLCLSYSIWAFRGVFINRTRVSVRLCVRGRECSPVNQANV